MQAVLDRWLVLFPESERSMVEMSVEDLARHYGAADRHHHDLGHPVEMIELLRPIWSELEDPNGTEFAVWIHDVIQEPKVGDDEKRSLAWGLSTLELLGVPENRFLYLKPCVMATRHDPYNAPVRSDARYVADADLGVFGASPERFGRYCNGVKREYWFVPPAIFWFERRKILQSFLDRRYIYFTEYFRDLYETQARRNLANVIQAIEALSA